MQTDEELMREFQNGSAPAFEELFVSQCHIWVCRRRLKDGGNLVGNHARNASLWARARGVDRHILTDRVHFLAPQTIIKYLNDGPRASKMPARRL